jgi:predicted GH43/DUF377 family glycosyl hydrolase
MMSDNGLRAVLALVVLSFVAYTIVSWLRSKRRHKEKPFTLHRAHGNPLLSPQDQDNWEACGVFNPAAYKDDDDIVHLLYRAIGTDGVSRLGYARSSDGITIDDRGSYAVFAIENPRHIGREGRHYNPVMYPSGGSWGGCEDPRLVKIEDKLYLTFNAFDGWDFIRIAFSSIDEKDFLAGRWNWKKTQLISPEGEINKNWVLFPEKIDGKFAILHSISPHVQIDYIDRLEDLAQGKKKIKSIFKREDRASWDTWLRGAGCPPIKTDKGWLVLYHAIEKHEGDRYKIGAFLLDLADPSKVIAKSPGPLLSPDCWYENDDKPGVVYVCGAVIRNGALFVYYGGGDRHTCVAQAPLVDVLNWLEYTN